jgi:hypothetical protein
LGIGIKYDRFSPGYEDTAQDAPDAIGRKGGYKYAIFFEKEGGFPINRTFVYPAWSNSKADGRLVNGYNTFRKDDSTIILYFEGEVLDNTQVEFKVYFEKETK